MTWRQLSSGITEKRVLDSQVSMQGYSPIAGLKLRVEFRVAVHSSGIGAQRELEWVALPCSPLHKNSISINKINPFVHCWC